MKQVDMRGCSAIVFWSENEPYEIVTDNKIIRVNPPIYEIVDPDYTFKIKMTK